MTKKQIKVKIPPQGSLGILALGHRGVLAWRKVRDEAEKNDEQKQQDKS